MRAAADTMDLMLEKISQNENKEAFVRNPLEEEKEVLLNLRRKFQRP